MTVKCVARRMASGGSGHEHISHLWWVSLDQAGDQVSEGFSTREQMVEFIEKNGDNIVWCPDRNPSVTGAWVRVNSNGYTKYVQTVADGRKTDNLLSLPLR